MCVYLFACVCICLCVYEYVFVRVGICVNMNILFRYTHKCKQDQEVMVLHAVTKYVKKLPNLDVISVRKNRGAERRTYEPFLLR